MDISLLICLAYSEIPFVFQFDPTKASTFIQYPLSSETKQGKKFYHVLKNIGQEKM